MSERNKVSAALGGLDNTIQSIGEITATEVMDKTESIKESPAPKESSPVTTESVMPPLPPPPPESESHKQLMREGEPMRITNLFVDRPCCIILICYFLLIAVTAISYAAGWFDMDP